MNQDGNFGISRRPSFFVPQETSYLETQTPPRSKKRKLFFVVIIIIAIVAVIFAAIAFLGWSSLEAKNLREAVNLFGNYVLTGEESTKDLPESVEINEYTSYRIGYVDASDNKDEKDQYFSKLQKYYEYIKKYYDDSDKTKYNREIVSDDSIKFLGDFVGFLQAFDDADKETDLNVLTYYRQNSDESTVRYINNHFKKYTSSNNDIIKNYFKLKKERFTSTRDLLSKIISSGCELNDMVNACLKGKNDGSFEEALAIREKIEKKKETASELRSNYFDILVSKMIDISNEIRRIEEGQ